MRVLIVYGTTEGHTRDLCHDLAERFREAGHRATVEEAGEDPSHPDAGAYDVAFLAASLHVGRYQPRLIRYARTQREALARRPSAFISVSLSAAGMNPEDWEGLETCLAKFEAETGWSPKAVHHAGGAIRYSQYDFFKRLAMKWIAAQRGQKTVTSHDYELTDREALWRFALDFARQNAPAAASEAAAGKTGPGAIP